jgi:hypothetical protein
VYKEDALALATVKKWYKRFVEGRTSLCDNPRSGRPLSNDLAEAMASMLKEKPFVSCKVLCRHFRIAKTTCPRILHDNLGMKRFNLRWVPHALNSTQKAERVMLSHEILAVLESNRRNSFQDVITGDESCFFFYYLRDSIWAQSRDEVPETISQKIDSEKCLISVLWSVNGIHSLEYVPKGTTYDSALLCEDLVLVSLSLSAANHPDRPKSQAMVLALTLHQMGTRMYLCQRRTCRTLSDDQLPQARDRTIT